MSRALAPDGPPAGRARPRGSTCAGLHRPRVGGYTLAELLVAMGVLMVVLGTALPLIFMGDRALSRQGDRAVQTAAATSLLYDLSRDLRTAHSIHLARSYAVVDGSTYQVTADGVTRAAGRGDDLRQYSGVRFAISSVDGVMHVNVRSGATRLQTAVVRRNR